MDDGLAHGFEDWLGAREGDIGSADHEGQGAGRSRGDPTGNRRIDHGKAGLVRPFDRLTRRFDIYGRTVDENGSHRRQPPDLVINTQDVLAGRQHGNHGVSRVARLLQRRGGSPRRDGVRHHVRVEVDREYRMTRLHQVGGHAGAHIAQTDKSDFHLLIL